MGTSCISWWIVCSFYRTQEGDASARKTIKRERERSSTLADLHTSFGTPKASNQKSRLFSRGKKKEDKKLQTILPSQPAPLKRREFPCLVGKKNKEKIKGKNKNTSWPNFVTTRKTLHRQRIQTSHARWSASNSSSDIVRNCHDVG
jgi:hypothetical protein